MRTRLHFAPDLPYNKLRKIQIRRVILMEVWRSAIRAHMDEEIAALQTLLRIRSVGCPGENGTVFGQGPQDCLEACLRLCASLGFATQSVDGYCGYAQAGAGEELVLVLGHLDVVPEGTGWHYPPYGAQLADGRLYGRGAIDDKGPLVAALYALRALCESGVPLRRRVRVLFGLNEESGSACVRHYVESGQELPVMGFTPDGSFPIIYAEKGIALAAYACRLTPGAHSLRSLEGGAAFNMVPAGAVAELDWPEAERGAACALALDGVRISETPGGLRVEADGVSAHGSTPEKGVNAIVRLAQALSRLPLDAASAAPVRFIAAHYPQGTRGEALGIACADAVSGDMVVNLGTAQTKNGVLTLGVNLRVPVTLGEADFHSALTAAMAAGGFTETAFSFEPPLYMPPESPLIRALQRVYARETGEAPQLLAIGGGTYAKAMPNTVAFGPVFPGEPCAEHEPDEYITLESLRRCTEIYAAALLELAG